MALQTSRLMTCPMAKGRTPPLGLGGGDDSRREVCAEDFSWDIGGGESPKLFPHAITWVTVEFGPSKSSARTGNLIASKSWQRKLCLSSSVKARVSVSPVRVLGSGSSFLLTSAAGGHSTDALGQLACPPTVPVFHS